MFMGLLGLLGTLFSTLFGYRSRQEEGQAYSAAAAYNAATLRQRGVLAQQLAAIRAQDKRKAAGRAQATARALYAAGNVSVSSGTPLVVQMDSLAEGELDAARELWAGRQQAQGYESQAQMEEYQGLLARRAARTAGYGTLLTGGLDLLKSGYKLYEGLSGSSAPSSEPNLEFGGL